MNPNQERDRMIRQLVRGERRTPTEVARLVGLTRERVRMIAFYDTLRDEFNASKRRYYRRHRRAIRARQNAMRAAGRWAR